MKVKFNFKNSLSIMFIFLAITSSSIPQGLTAQDYYEEDRLEDNVNENTLAISKDTEVCSKVLNQTCCPATTKSCCDADQAECEDWLGNRKMLLVAVPAIAGGIAVALAASSKHNVSYYTGSAYSCYGYDGYYDCYYNSSYDGSYSHHSHQSGSYDKYSERVARFTSSLTIETLNGSAVLTATLIGQDGTVYGSSALTVTTPGIYNFSKLEVESQNCIYQLHVNFTLDGASSIQGTLATVATFSSEETAESSSFSGAPNQAGEIIQTFNFCDESSSTSH